MLFLELFEVLLFDEIDFLLLDLSLVLEGKSLLFAHLLFLLLVSFGFELFVFANLHFSASVIGVLDEFLNVPISHDSLGLSLLFLCKLFNFLLMFLVFELVLNLARSSIQSRW